MYSPNKISFILILFMFLILGGCQENQGNIGPRGPRGASPTNLPSPTPTTNSFLPGIVITITQVTGGSGPNGNFQSGDYISFTYTLKYNDGTDLPLSELSGAYIVFGGPTHNYQKVLPSGRTDQYYLDLQTNSTKNADNSYTYTFPDPIPATYGPPLYDTTKFSSQDEWTGNPLVDGTYTIGIAAFKYYYIDGKFYTDVGNTTRDILVGNATILDSREVVNQYSCNQCHQTLMYHDGIFRDVKLCLLCHTAGAEDVGSTDSGDGTNATIEFKVMIHKIHNGKHLPSVVGISRDNNGDPVYDTTLFNNGGGTYLIGQSDPAKAKDFSKVEHPIWPNKTYPMAHDAGWWSSRPQKSWTLDQPTDQELMEEMVDKGFADCNKCHGDPDGSGPLSAPLQGSYAYTKPSRRVCGSCHDDWDPTKPYRSNNQTMPPQADDSNCSSCHPQSGSSLAIQESHTHPYYDPNINKGFNIKIQSISGGTGPGGNFQIGDKITVTFRITDDNDNDIPFPVLPSNPNRFDHPNGRLYAAINGPSYNRQILLHTYIPHTLLSGGPVYTITLPQRYDAELLGIVTDTSPADGQSDASIFNTSHKPIHNNGPFLAVYEAVPDTGSTQLSADAPLQQNYIEVLDGAPFKSTFGWPAVAVDYGNPNEEILLVQYAQTGTNPQRLWFFSSLKRKPPLCGNYADCHLPGGFDNEGVTGSDQRRDCKRCHDMTWGPGTGWFAWGADIGVYTAWPFFPPALRQSHLSGAPVQKMKLTLKQEGTDYTLDANNGTITLVTGRWTIGARVVIFYSSDFTIPSVYPPPLYSTETMNETNGRWNGKSIVSGTYRLGLWSFQINQPLVHNERNIYHIGTPPAVIDFNIGTSTTIDPNNIVSEEKCNRCHNEIVYHGGTRRGFRTCLLCHGTAGFEDRPHYNLKYEWEGADWWSTIPPESETPDVLLDFRTIIHKIHKGKDLSQASTFKTTTTPSWEFNRYSGFKTYDSFSFPAMPGKVRNCAACHEGSSWKEPQNRDHPTEQVFSVKKWAFVCGSCHDSPVASSHIKSMSSTTGEMCSLCHNSAKVESYHRNGYQTK
ncbi:MAG: hypothetical protein D6785_06045 [Planctomycetota bacterium]|nr:MAG: hypothetical protein D6785_06045 [Planctomycetota bacterium]